METEPKTVRAFFGWKSEVASVATGGLANVQSSAVHLLACSRHREASSAALE